MYYGCIADYKVENKPNIFVRSFRSMREKHLFFRGFVVYSFVSFVFCIIIGMWRMSLLKMVANGLINDFTVAHAFRLTLFVSVLLSVLSSLIDVFVINRFLRKLSFGLSFLLSSILQPVIISFIIFRSYQFVMKVLIDEHHHESISVWEIPYIEYVAFFFLVVISVSHFILEIDKRLGRFNLWRLRLSSKIREKKNASLCFCGCDRFKRGKLS